MSTAMDGLTREEWDDEPKPPPDMVWRRCEDCGLRMECKAREDCWRCPNCNGLLCTPTAPRVREHFAPPPCDVCGSPTHREERLLPGESGGRVAHQLCYWRQRALAAERR